MALSHLCGPRGKGCLLAPRERSSTYAKQGKVLGYRKRGADAVVASTRASTMAQVSAWKPPCGTCFHWTRRKAHWPGFMTGTGRVLSAQHDRFIVRCNAGGTLAREGLETQRRGHSPPPKMTGAAIREAFLSFFESKQHIRLPGSSLVPEDPTVLLTIAGMLQFKPIFLGQEPIPKTRRVATTQKCIRTNDIENVGVTARHHTFFEMLGNFSFGDYFKKEAIQWAWELSVNIFRLPSDRIWVSIFEDDDEAYDIWRNVVGVPDERIQRLTEKDNFWSSGPTGPCGPCSELYYDMDPRRGTNAADLEDDTRFIEYYNLVFMQYNRLADGQLEVLANQFIDTGMGLERMAQILQGVANNYETDLILPIVMRAAEIAQVDYDSAAEATKTSLKVIGDHIRAVTYLLSDNVTPSNIGRGYVVRRLLRRVVMKGRLLGIDRTFTPEVATAVVALSRPCDAAVAGNAERIYAELAREEEAFSHTLERGQKMLADVMNSVKAGGERTIPGKTAFMLFDTLGFPLELTQELAEMQGLQVDAIGFEHEMEAQRARSRGSRTAVTVNGHDGLGHLASSVPATEFIGYESLNGEARVVGLMDRGEVVVSKSGDGDELEVILDKTPFYAEGGGQISDRGVLVLENNSRTSLLEVTDVKRRTGGQTVVHTCRIQHGDVRVGDTVSAQVDKVWRARVKSHHTATHLLQAALRQVLGASTCQQGSSVTCDRLRFDFNSSRPVTSEELSRIEALVNGWVAEASALTTGLMPLEEAKSAGALAMFGEKYDDVVRVVHVPEVSMELCGGTHVSNTAEVGAFKIVSESSIASGIRRIEAVAGLAAVEYLNSMDAYVSKLCATLRVKPEELERRVSAMLGELKEAEKRASALKAQVAVATAQSLVTKTEQSPKGFQVLVAHLEAEEVDAKALQEVVLQLQKNIGSNAAVLLATTAGGRVNFAAAFGKEVVAAGAHAGKLIGAVARVCGGGGGGKPGVAQAGGRHTDKLPQALDVARQELGRLL